MNIISAEAERTVMMETAQKSSTFSASVESPYLRIRHRIQ
eukprot:COSAG01_NODE_88_length_27337_cov_22.941699_9_plen_40_part_00